MGKIDYNETFSFPDIPYQIYPVYAITESGKVVNLKSIIYPSPSSKKRFTRKKQLSFRSLQAKIFDSLINIGYWDPLPVIKEFPVVIQNSQRKDNQKGLFYYLDYYFPTLRLAVELDSSYHNEDSDLIRDTYLKDILGIETFRIFGLEKESVQKNRFKELTAYMRTLNPTDTPEIFLFSKDILNYKKGV